MGRLALDLVKDGLIDVPHDLLDPRMNKYVINLDSDPLLSMKGRCLFDRK